MIFDVYAFADYSGATSKALQHKAIAWSVFDRVTQQATVTSGWTRQTLHSALVDLLVQSSQSKKRVIFGFDHCYSFPYGFYQAVTCQKTGTWQEMLGWYYHDIKQSSDDKNEINPRLWAHRINQLLINRDGFLHGPFWGPNFSPLKKQFIFEIPVPKFPHLRWHERRVVESKIKALKNIFQLGGAGSVGLQSLYGMYYIYELMEVCRIKGIPLHVWPYDGWDIPLDCHVLVEVYATLYLMKNSGKRTDQGDANACTAWVSSQDESGNLGTFFKKDRLELTVIEEERVEMEGWVLGI